VTPRALRAIAASALTLLVAAALAAAAPPGGDIPFRDAILVYADAGRDWSSGSFEYYLAYIDKDGRPQDWLFDGFLFLAITAKSKRNFWDGKADSTDWDWWFEKLFEPGRQLDALEGDVRSLGAKLGPSSPRRVILSIPRPPIDADAGGQEAVVKGFVDRCVRRFAEKAYRHITLEGFYWFHEGVDGTNADLVNSLHRDLSGRGLRLYWIPYDVGHENRAHLEKWQAGEIRFDGVWLQPNYFWADRNEKYAAQDLDDTVSAARTMGSCVEIEFDHGARATGWKLGRYTHYLMSADVFGYRNGPLMYYDGYRGYIECGQSRNPVQRAIYDDLYWFTRKAYLPKPMTYPGQFIEILDPEAPIEADSRHDPAARPEIGLHINKGGGGARMELVEPDPNKDYFVILRAAGTANAKLEALIAGSWLRLEATAAGEGSLQGAPSLERYRLPRHLIQTVWNPKTPLVVKMRRTGEGAVTEGWARPDDFVFRYVKGKQPMETESRLELDGSAATLSNFSGETVIGLRLADAGGRAEKAGLTISAGPLRSKHLAPGVDKAGDPVWIAAKPDGQGKIKIRLDAGLEISELWAFPAAEFLHLRPGSCGDTNAGLHVPGISLVPDGRWRLAGEFGRNHRTGEAGAEARVTVPDVPGPWELSLLADAAAECTVEALQGGAVKAAVKIAGRSSQRVSIILKSGDYALRFSGPVALHDAWLAIR
jgi:hypothetical protein